MDIGMENLYVLALKRLKREMMPKHHTQFQPLIPYPTSDPNG